ncbi:MAG: hypothetical protein A3E78_10905 [Alphaproteobacteria bacterium RIFCSPHIGHO2_12_FULL_63_12]|nr:MAG: hypothetical protein A3E78_10905 [Alphaproteobacteria bacterium RIFCSPHIGHO2_12_FULL_63_12]
MPHRKFILALVALAGCSATPPGSAGTGLFGEWGGDHIALTISDVGAAIESDCAHGRIDVPFTIDAAGAFALSGVWTPEHGGPVRQDEVETALPARYSGKVEGRVLTLSIEIASPAAHLGPFTLQKGRAPNLLKCL